MIINKESFDCNCCNDIIMVAGIEGAHIEHVSLYQKERDTLNKYKLIYNFNDNENIEQYVTINMLKDSEKEFIVSNYDKEYDKNINIKSLKNNIVNYILDNSSNPFFVVINKDEDESFSYTIDENDNLIIYKNMIKIDFNMKNIFYLNIDTFVVRTLKRKIESYIKALKKFKYDLSNIPYKEKYPTVFTFHDKETIDILADNCSGDIGCMFYYDRFFNKYLDDIGIIYNNKKTLLCKNRIILFNEKTGLIIGKISETLRLILSKHITLLPEESRYYRKMIKMYYDYK